MLCGCRILTIVQDAHTPRWAMMEKDSGALSVVLERRSESIRSLYHFHFSLLLLPRLLYL